MADLVNVPNAPGVPSVNFAAAAGAPISYLIGLASGQQWGIYLGGAPVILCDNVVSFEYRKAWSISDYPIEEGAFTSYDKVETPFMTRVQLSTGGGPSDRAAFIASVDAIAGDTNLYDVVTPEKVYINCNVSRLDYGRRADQGAGLVVIDIGLEEIRLQAAAARGNTASPSSAPLTNGGAVQAAPATPAQAAFAPVIAGPPAPPSGFTGF